MALRASIATRGRLLMSLSEFTKDNPEVAVKLTELAKHAGISLDEARYAFFWLLENVFVQGHWHSDGKDANMQITVKGSDEAERLRWPFWKRLASTRDLWVALGATVIGGIIVGVILKWLP